MQRFIIRRGKYASHAELCIKKGTPGLNYKHVELKIYFTRRALYQKGIARVKIQPRKAYCSLDNIQRIASLLRTRREG